MAGSTERPFYHREEEFATLERLIRDSAAAFVICYGRRRVGKTTLLRKWAAQSGLPYFYWQSPRYQTPDNLRTDLVRELHRWSSAGDSEAAPRYDSWRDVFRVLGNLAGRRPAIVILDEFSWAVESDPALPSYLMAAWDGMLSDRPIKLILAGSHISAMEGLLSSDAPLFGRLTGKLLVRPFSFIQITPFIRRYPPDKRLAVYAILGGVADYLRRWKDIADLKTNIAAIFLSDESPYRNESEVLISDVLRRKSPDYAAVLSAVARGLHDLADIATNAVLASDRTAGVLDTLLDLRLVEKRIRASVPPERQAQARYARYFLADPFLRFYYRFIEPNRTLIAERDFKEVLSLIEQQLRPFVAETFEELCREWTRQQGLRNQLPFRPEYVSSDWFGSEYQADVVAVNWRQAQVFVGEAKWGESLVDMPVYRALLERLPRVTKRMPHKKDWTTHAALFARKGFTRAVIEAARREHVRLVAFADMVRDLQTPR